MVVEALIIRTLRDHLVSLILRLTQTLVQPVVGTAVPVVQTTGLMAAVAAAGGVVFPVGLQVLVVLDMPTRRRLGLQLDIHQLQLFN